MSASWKPFAWALAVGLGLFASQVQAQLAGVLENSIWTIGADGVKNHLDDDDNNNFGYRVGFNTSTGGSMGFQIGMNYANYDLHGREDGDANGFTSGSEQHIFITAGFYKNACECDPWSAGLVYDFFHGDNFGEGGGEHGVILGQLRGMLGYQISCAHELGVWGAVGVDDYLMTVDLTFPIETRDQVNVYLKSRWESGATTMFYVGLADGPQGFMTGGGNFVDDGVQLEEIMLGFRGVAPLTCNLGLYGNFTYLLPTTSAGDNPPGPNNINAYAEEAWNVSFGLVFAPGGLNGCPGVRPLQDVADHGLFLINSPRGEL